MWGSWISQNLEVKRINDEKKAALAAQIAAEATVRRVQLAAAQKDENQLLPWSIDAIVAPLESELKLARQEVSLVIQLQCLWLLKCNMLLPGLVLFLMIQDLYSCENL